MPEVDPGPQAASDGLTRWRWAGVLATLGIVLSVPLYLLRRQGIEEELAATAAPVDATFVGRAACIDCHRRELELWVGSDHDLAMDVANESTVLGDFDDATFEHGGVTSTFFRRDGRYFVRTEGPDGELADFEITHVFGHDPLQQVLIPFPGGRLQALSTAWDRDESRWFFLYPDRDIPPDDWLHWTRNAQNWNGMCAECHSTHLEKGYDAATDSYATSWSEIDVSCEACHGPGSSHVAWAEIDPMARPQDESFGLVVSTRDLDNRQLVELCAPCHSRRSEMGDYDHAGEELMDTLLPALLDEGLYYADGQILDEVYVYGSFLQSKMYASGVACSDCHDVHSGRLRYEGNDLCLQCHREADYDRYEHHFHKKVHEGEPSAGALCVSCHMPQKPYMVIDERADHSLRVPRPDLTLEVGTPNACAQSGCHADKPVSWMVDAYRSWYGKARKPHYGPILAAGRAGNPEALEDLIRLASDPLVSFIVRATALDLVSRYPGEASRKALLRGLTDEEALVRHQAIAGLVPGEPEEWIATLAPLLFDPVRLVRLEAASRLAGVPRERLKDYQQEALEANLRDFRDAMERSLDFAHAGYNLGNHYAQMGDRARAAEYYEKALAVDELFLPAKMNLAVLYNGEGRNAEAAALLREVLAADSENAEAAYSLGLLLAEMGDLPGAAEQLARTAALRPGEARTYYNLGLVLRELGRSEEAIDALAQAVALAPGDLGILHAYADLFLRTGELERAAEIARSMLAIDPSSEVAGQILHMTQAPGGSS